jgi:ADP-heptose:LPS heptosyltransferase
MDLPTTNEPIRVIIPVVAGIGNALMAVPMVRQLKRGRPGARITIMARMGAMAEPFRRLGEVDEVLVTGGGLGGTLGMLRWSRARRADVFLVPFPSNRWQYNLLAQLSGARQRIMHGFDNARVRSLGFHGATRVPAIRGIHDVDQNLRLLAAMHISTTPESPAFAVNDEDRARGEALLGAAGVLTRDRFIAVHPGSARTILAQAKRWPAEKYAELILELLEDASNQVLVLEGPDESGVGDEIAAAMRDKRDLVSVVRLAGPLGDAAAVLERAALYVGSDSGLGHLAAAVGTRAVTIFAPADPERVCPYGNRDLVVQVKKDCSPCLQYPWKTPYPKILCRQPMCVTEVKVEEVMQAVRRALANIASLNLIPSPSGRGLG